MIKRTHLAIGAALVLLFLPHVNYKIVFSSVLLIASLLPDIDHPNSTYGSHWIFRPLQFFVKHRGILHTMTINIAASVLFAFIIPVIALPFFLGYSTHLIADSFTKDGITVFWPSKTMIGGNITTGGRVEYAVFVTFIIIDALLLINLFA